MGEIDIQCIKTSSRNIACPQAALGGHKLMPSHSKNTRTTDTAIQPA